MGSKYQFKENNWNVGKRTEIKVFTEYWMNTEYLVFQTSDYWMNSEYLLLLFKWLLNEYWIPVFSRKWIVNEYWIPVFFHEVNTEWIVNTSKFCLSDYWIWILVFIFTCKWLLNTLKYSVFSCQVTTEYLEVFSIQFSSQWIPKYSLVSLLITFHQGLQEESGVHFWMLHFLNLFVGEIYFVIMY